MKWLATFLLLIGTTFGQGIDVFPPTSGGGSNFPVAVTGTVTSGGIPCFTSTSVEATSALLTANLPILGGGAGGCVSVGTVTGNTTKFVTGNGAYVNGHGLVVDANFNIIDSGAAPAGGTGNAAALVSVTSAATVNYPCPTTSAATVVIFSVTTLATSITSSTQNTQVCNSSHLIFIFPQNGTGGFTAAMPAGFASCLLNPAANIVTVCSYSWDGTNGRLESNTSTAGYSFGQTVSAPATPPANDYFTWVDSVSGKYCDMANNSATQFCALQSITGTATLGTSAIGSGACATVVTVAATGVATTDIIKATFNADVTAVTGYGASATGAVLTIYPFPTSNNVNFKVCNNTANSITPGAATLNWRVEK